MKVSSLIKFIGDRDKLAKVILSTFIDVQDGHSFFFDSCSEVRYLTVTCYFRKIVLIFIILCFLMLTLLPIGTNKDYCC